MKRFLIVVLMMMVFISFSTAEETNAYPSQRILCKEDQTDLVINCNGILYIHCESGIYRLTVNGDKELVISASELLSGIVSILSDADCVYALQYENRKAELVKLIDRDGEVLNQSVIQLEDVSWSSMTECVLRNGILYYIAGTENFDESIIDMISLSEGTKKTIKVENLTGFDVTDDGNIVVLKTESGWMEKNIILEIISPKTGELTEWTSIDNDLYLSGILYDDNTETVYCIGQREVYAVQKGEQPRTIGISVGQDICSVCLLNNGLAIASRKALNIVSFGEELYNQRTSLTICGPYAEDEFFTSFYETHPMTDIRVIDTYVSEPEERFINDMLTQNVDVDIYILHDLNLLSVIKSKGYYADLSVSEVIKEKIGRMYDPFVQAFTYKEDVAAFPHPWYVFFTTISYNTKLFHDLSLNVPTTWEEFFDFCIEWKEQYEDENPDVFVNPFDHDLSLVSLLAHYDDEMTRDGIAADYQSEMLESIVRKYLQVKELYEYEEGNGKPLFYDYDLHTASDELAEYYLMPLTFMKSSDPIYTPMEGDVYYFVVNPYSNHLKEAVECVAEAKDISRMNDPSIYKEIPDLPLESAYYEEGLEQYQEKLDMLEARKKLNEEEPEKLLEINAEIDKTKKEMEEYRTNGRYWFTEEDMIPYRELNSHVYFSDFNPIRELYAKDPSFFDQVTEESLHDFLYRLDNRIQMIIMERKNDID